MSAVVHAMPGVAADSIVFGLLFVKKIIVLPGGRINDLSSGRVLFSFITSSNSSSNLERLFDWHGALQGLPTSPNILIPKLQKYKDTVRCARRWGPQTPLQSTAANLDYVFFKTLFYTETWI